MSQASSRAKPSQDFVPIEQVRDGIMVLKDGTVRAVLMASSINIVLKSEDEQTAILKQFENFLNSLDFSIQIFIQSRELDIRPYLALLEQQLETQQTDENSGSRVHGLCSRFCRRSKYYDKRILCGGSI